MSTTVNEEQSTQSTEIVNEVTTASEEKTSEKKSEPSTESGESNSNLPVVRGDNPYSVMDALDDELIKAELENRITNVWVYTFKQQGKDITGLSKVGVDAACTEMAKSGHIIEESQVQHSIDPTDDGYVLFTVTASRVLVDLSTGKRIVLETVNGTKRQAVKMKSRGSFVPDPFWFEKGAMKAVRNARSRLIPEEVKATIISLAKEGGKVQRVHTEKESKKEEPTDAVQYAEGKDKKFIEAWIGDKIGKGEMHRKLFKYWAAGFNMIGKNDDGVYTLNKLDMRLVTKIRSASDDAADSFGNWYNDYLIENKVESAEEAAKLLDGTATKK